MVDIPQVLSQTKEPDTKKHDTSQASNRLDEVTLDELSKKSLAEGGRAALDDDTSIGKSGDLGVSTTLTTADDGTSVAHAATRRSGDTGNERNSGLVVDVVGLEELGGILLSGTTNLTDHDDTIGLGVLEEDLQAVDEVGAGEGVTADTDNERLAKAGLGGLVDGLVGQGTGAGDDADATTLVDEARHDTDLALALMKQRTRSEYGERCRLDRIALTGAMIPGQLGPTRRVLFWVLRMSVMRTMSKNH